MKFSHHILENIIAISAVLIALWWGLNYFSEDILDFFQVEDTYQVFFGEVGMKVTVADEEAEWKQGLSEVTELGELEGKLFIFPQEDYYGMWMKDMNIPIDMIWLNDEFTVVHIEASVSPDTYPETFSSPDLARFVLEANAYFTQSYNITVGSQIRLPARLIPPDLRN